MKKLSKAKMESNVFQCVGARQACIALLDVVTGKKNVEHIRAIGKVAEDGIFENGGFVLQRVFPHD